MARTYQPVIGIRRVGYEVQPCAANEYPINGGRHFVNADSLLEARAWAARILTNPTYYGHQVEFVTITGQTWERTYDGWHPLPTCPVTVERINRAPF